MFIVILSVVSTEYILCWAYSETDKTTVIETSRFVEFIIIYQITDKKVFFYYIIIIIMTNIIFYIISCMLCCLI